MHICIWMHNVYIHTDNSSLLAHTLIDISGTHCYYVLLFGSLVSWQMCSNTSGQTVFNCLWRQEGYCWLCIPLWACNKPFGKQALVAQLQIRGCCEGLKLHIQKNLLYYLGQSKPKCVTHVSLLSFCVLTAAAGSSGCFGCPTMSSVWPLCEAGSKVLWSQWEYLHSSCWSLGLFDVALQSELSWRRGGPHHCHQDGCHLKPWPTAQANRRNDCHGNFPKGRVPIFQSFFLRDLLSQQLKKKTTTDPAFVKRE